MVWPVCRHSGSSATQSRRFVWLGWRARVMSIFCVNISHQSNHVTDKARFDAVGTSLILPYRGSVAGPTAKSICSVA